MNKEQDADFTRGFLPSTDPLTTLPCEFDIWEGMGQALPKLLLSNYLHETFNELPLLDTEMLHNEAAFERAMVLLSFFGHAYVFGKEPPSTTLPPSIAVPWYAIAQRLGRPPVLSYASYALNNWRRIDQAAPIELGNIVLLQNFLGGKDEEWFVLVHIDIEMKAAPAIKIFPLIKEAILRQDSHLLENYLSQIATALENMCHTLDRMPEHCDPYIYYNRVRPYIYGWKDNPALPSGMIYQGVSAYDKPQYFRGETGAQSTIIPSFDAILGIQHEKDPLRVYLMEMRDYMPMPHRHFLQSLEKSPSMRNYILSNYHSYPSLRDAYNTCLELLSRFRQTHLKYAATYIQKQSQTSAANPTDIGTGGTPFMTYLKKHKDETLAYLIR